jgi:carbon monoxide dehydrogenase subunit G
MVLDHRVTVPSDAAKAWAFLMDIAAVAECMPGVEAIETVDDDNYRGVMVVRLGSIRVRFEGGITVLERDPVGRRARLQARGTDKRVGGAVNATVDMSLEPSTTETVDLVVHTDTAILGKLGELGQAVIRKRADQVVSQFAENMATRLTASATVGTVAEARSDHPSPEKSGAVANTDVTEGSATKMSPPVHQRRWERIRAWWRRVLSRKSPRAGRGRGS